MNKSVKRKHARFSPAVIVFTVILLLYVISLVIPFIWGFFTSLKGNIEFSLNVLGLPKGHIWEWRWDNYAYVFNNFSVEVIKGTERYNVNMFQQLLYSILYSLGGGLLGAFTPCVVGYLISRFPNKFSRVLYSAVIIVMVIPIVGSEVSMLQLLRSLHLYDTMIGNLIMSMNFLTMYLLVYHAAFKSLSNSYAEAAEIDGANEFTVFFRINFPLVRGTFFTILLLLFIARWNDYTSPLLYMPSKPTLAYGVFAFNSSTQTTLSWPPMKITGCMILVIPILIVFLIFHEKIMGNITMGGVKE